MSGHWTRPSISRMRAIAVRTLRLGITAALVGVLVAAVDLGEVGTLLATADAGALALALLFALADRGVMIGKWYPLLRVQSNAIPLAAAAKAYLSAGFAATFLPSSVGGDVVRTLLLRRRGPGALEIGASIVAERVLGLLGLAASSLIAVAIGATLVPGFAPLLAPLAAILLAAIALTTLLLVPAGQRLLERLTALAYFAPLRQLALRLVAAMRAYQGHGRTLFLVAWLSLLEQAMPVLVMWAIAIAIGSKASLLMLLVAVPPTYLMARIPVSFSGLGILEGTLIVLLGLFGISSSEALTLAMLSRVVSLVAVAPGAFGWSELVLALQGARPSISIAPAGTAIGKSS